MHYLNKYTFNLNIILLFLLSITNIFLLLIILLFSYLSTQLNYDLILYFFILNNILITSFLYLYSNVNLFYIILKIKTVTIHVSYLYHIF